MQKIHPFGHKILNGPNGVLQGTVIIEEKVDGSFISWSLNSKTNELEIRSKGQQLNLDLPEKMFSEGITYLKSIRDKLKPDWVYRGEYLKSKKHNAINYDRFPNNHIILFDVMVGMEDYMSYEDMISVGKDLDLEVVPLLYNGPGEDIDQDKLLKMMDKTSILGGAKMEGVVVKNYARYEPDGKMLMAKLVSSEFKEVHRKEWKNDNPTSKDVLLNLIDEYKTEARWQKAFIHLEEKGLLVHEPKDIAPLLKEIQRDVEEECADEIKDKLWNWAKTHILRGSINGAAVWYKDKLVKDGLMIMKESEKNE